MTDTQFHSYRFNDETDPTDEQLAELIHRAAEDARERGRIAQEKFQAELRKAWEEAKNRATENKLSI